MISLAHSCSFVFSPRIKQTSGPPPPAATLAHSTTCRYVNNLLFGISTHDLPISFFLFNFFFSFSFSLARPPRRRALTLAPPLACTHSAGTHTSSIHSFSLTPDPLPYLAKLVYFQSHVDEIANLLSRKAQPWPFRLD
jgi:hypothetical protein